MGRVFDRGVWAGIALLLGLLVVNAGLTYHNTRQLRLDAGWVAHTHEVLELTAGTLLALMDAETGQRGFLLTGNEEFLQPYAAALPRLRERLANLAALTRDNPHAQDRVAELEQRAASELALLQRGIDLRRKHADLAQLTLLARQGKQHMDAIRELVAAMQEEEHGLLAQRRRQSQAAYRVAVTTGFLTALLGLGTVALFTQLLRRSLLARQQAAAVLASQRELLRTTLASIGDAVITTDTRGQVTSLNAAAQALTGWSQAEAAGQPLGTVVRLVHEQTRRPVEDPIRRPLREGTAVGQANHTLLIARDGTELPIEDSAAPIRGEAGAVAGVVLVLRDVREQRRAALALRQSEERYRLIVETAQEGIWLLDADGKIEVANARLAELLGWTRDELRGRALADFLDAASRKGLEAHEERRRQGASEQVEVRFRRWDGSELWGLVSTGPVRDAQGRFLGTLGLVTDITERKRLEDELRRRAEQLQEADRRKDEFLAMLAHELRNPLAPVRNALQILKMPGVRPEVVRQAREMMERQVRHLVRLVDDLLDVSRLMRNKITLRRERVDLGSIFGQALETARPALDAQGHELSVALPPEPVLVEGDPVRLAQVVSNLLLNAAKYTERGGRITLGGGREEGQAVLRVRDTGMGIDPELLPHIFDLFTQADRSLARSQGGLGIGLTVVKRLVEMHGGTVRAESGGPGQGSEFIVRLPALPPEPADRFAGPDEDPVAPAGPGRRVLIVDDSTDAAQSTAVLLRLLGHEVATAPDGPSALALVPAFRPDVVLLDIGLPGMSGLDVARALRVRPENRGLVLVAVTGYGQDEDRRRSREAGLDYHLTKPVDPAALGDLLAGLPTPA